MSLVSRIITALLLTCALLAASCANEKTEDPELVITRQMDLCRDLAARVDQLLEQNPDATAEDLLQALQGNPEIKNAGIGEGRTAWAQLGVPGPLYIVTINPTPYREPFEAAEQAAPQSASASFALAAEGANLPAGKKYTLYQTSFSGQFDRNDEIARMLDAKGYVRAGLDAQVRELRSSTSSTLLYINTHGTLLNYAPEPGSTATVRYFTMVTSTPAEEWINPANPGTFPREYADDLISGRLDIVSVYDIHKSSLNPFPQKTVVRRYAINEDFVRQYMSFGENSFLFLNSCFGGHPEAGSWRQTLFDKGLSVYAGWSDEAEVVDIGNAAVFLFDRLLGINEAEPVPDPPQRPFAYDSVLKEMQKHGLDKAVHPRLDGSQVVATLKFFKSPSKPQGFGALAPSIKNVAVDEQKKELTMGGLFGQDPGPSKRKVTVGGQQLTVKEGSWEAESITCEIPVSTAGDVLVTVDDHESNPVQLTEWSLTFSHQAATEIPDVGSSQGTTTFTVRFRADVHEYRPDAGEPPAKLVLVPFEVESDGKMSWNGTATALGQTATVSGSTSHMLDIDYTDPEWLFSLPPETDFLAGEGYIDMLEKKLYLFLVGVGENCGAGTYNLGSITDCTHYRDQTTNRTYLVFPLDESFQIQGGSCDDQIPYTSSEGNGIMTTGTRRWEFTTRHPPDPQAAR